MQTWAFHAKKVNKLNGKMIFNNQFKPVPSTNIFYYIRCFWEGSLATKKLTIALLDVFEFFFASCFSTSPLTKLFISFSNIFAIIESFAFTCFFNVVIPFVVLYMIRPCLGFRVTKQNWTIVTKNISHGLWAFHINILIIIRTKNPNVKNLYYVTSTLLFEFAICKFFYCFFFHFLGFGYFQFEDFCLFHILLPLHHS